MSTPTIKLLKSLEATGAKICGDLDFRIGDGDLFIKDGTNAFSFVKDAKFQRTIEASDFGRLVETAKQLHSQIELAQAVVAKITEVEAYVANSPDAPAVGRELIQEELLLIAQKYGDPSSSDYDPASPIRWSTSFSGMAFMHFDLPTDGISLDTYGELDAEEPDASTVYPGGAVPYLWRAFWQLGIRDLGNLATESWRNMLAGQVWMDLGEITLPDGTNITYYGDRSSFEADYGNRFYDWTFRSSGIYVQAPSIAGVDMPQSESDKYTLETLKDEMVGKIAYAQAELANIRLMLDALVGQDTTNDSLAVALAGPYTLSTPSDVVLADNSSIRRVLHPSNELEPVYPIANVNANQYPELVNLVNIPEGSVPVFVQNISRETLAGGTGLYYLENSVNGSYWAYASGYNYNSIIVDQLRVENLAGEVQIQDVDALNEFNRILNDRDGKVESLGEVLDQLGELKTAINKFVANEQIVRSADVEGLELSMEIFVSDFIQSLSILETILRQHISVSRQRLVEYGEGVIQETIVNRWMQVHEADRASASFSYSDFIGATGLPSEIRVLLDLDNLDTVHGHRIVPNSREDISKWIIRTSIEKTNGVVINERIWSNATVIEEDGNKHLVVDIRTAHCDNVYENDNIIVTAIYTGELDYGKEHDYTFQENVYNCNNPSIPTINSDFDADITAENRILEQPLPSSYDCYQGLLTWEVLAYDHDGDSSTPLEPLLHITGTNAQMDNIALAVGTVGQPVIMTDGVHGDSAFEFDLLMQSYADLGEIDGMRTFRIMSENLVNNLSVGDRGTLEYRTEIIIFGCTDPGYLEYNPDAAVDDGSCATLRTYGCMDPTASNYDSAVTDDDGSCQWILGTGTGETDIFHFGVFHPQSAWYTSDTLALGTGIGSEFTPDTDVQPVTISSGVTEVYISLHDAYDDGWNGGEVTLTYTDTSGNAQIHQLQFDGATGGRAVPQERLLSQLVGEPDSGSTIQLMVNPAGDWGNEIGITLSLNSVLGSGDTSEGDSSGDPGPQSYLFFNSGATGDIQIDGPMEDPEDGAQQAGGSIFGMLIHDEDGGSPTAGQAMSFNSVPAGPDGIWLPEAIEVKWLAAPDHPYYDTSPMSDPALHSAALQFTLVKESSSEPAEETLLFTVEGDDYVAVFMTAVEERTVILEVPDIGLHSTGDFYYLRIDELSGARGGPTAVVFTSIQLMGAQVGCTDPTALNYNSDAAIDDGSCEYEPVVEGCMDPSATNYNPDATVDDGSCMYDEPDEEIYGCTDPSYSNYNPDATVDDGSCA